MRIKYFIASLLLITCANAQTAIKTLTIDDLVALTLKHNPDIKSSRFDFDAAKERNRAAESFYLPHLDLSASAGKEHNSFISQDIQTDIFMGTLSASQLIYDFGKTSGVINSTKEQSHAYEAQMYQLISDQIFYVKKSYYNILKAKSIIDVQTKNVELQKHQLHRANRYLLSGIKTIIDVTDAKVQVEQAKLDLENAKYNLELERAKLEQYMGFSPYEGKYIVYSKKLKLRNLSKSLPELKNSLSFLENFSYKHRYAMASSNYSVSSAKANVETKRGDYLPTLAVGASLTQQKVDSAMPTLPEQQGKIALEMRWNLFSGFETDANVQEAKIAVLKASSQKDAVRLAIKRQVVESYIGLRRSKKSVELSNSIAKASLKKFQQAQKRYENDLADYIELQNAQQGYIQSLSDLVTSYYDYYISMAQLDHAIGK